MRFLPFWSCRSATGGPRGAGAVMEFLARLFDTASFPARWNCGDWSTGHGLLHIVSDSAIAGAYLAIPTVLVVYILKRRQELPFPRVFLLFACFIFFCGTTHLVEAIIFYQPVYRFSGLLKLLTAIVSWMTVAYLIRVAPRALDLPGIARVNSELRSEMVERRKAEELAQRRSAELETMIYVISHDLRQPLRGTRLYVDLLKHCHADGLGPEALDYLAKIDQSSERLSWLIDDVMNLARAHHSLRPTETIAARELVDQALARLGSTIELAGARVGVVGDLGELVVDRIWAIEAIYNLIGNAVKYAGGERPAEVEITALRDAAGNRGLVIADRGPGIPEDQREKVFQLFQRGADQRIEGTGAGLAIVRQVAEGHGGYCRVEDNPGGGARFFLALTPSGRVGHEPA